MARNKSSTSIGLAHALDVIQKGIKKMKRILEGFPKTRVSVTDYMMLCAMVNSMCTTADTCKVSPILYNKYQDTYREYITSVVLPSLREKHGEFLLRELVKRWLNHKIMTRWLSGIFRFLDRHFIPQRYPLPPLNEVGLTCFREMVWRRLYDDVMNAALSLIDREREGEQIDLALLKKVLDFFAEMGTESLDCENEFETAMLNDTAAYYSQKASNWMLDYSCLEYMQKAEECLKRERDRVSQYLHSSSETRLLKIVQYNLLYKYGDQLLENEHSGCDVLLGSKAEDLSRIYRLFSKLPGGLEFVGHIFKQHVDMEATALVKLAKDAARNKKAEKREVIGLQEQLYVRELAELHDKFMGYVHNCFQNDSLFHRVVREVFQFCFNKSFAGSSGAELLATFCDNILKKGGTIKLSDEAIEETLEKVVKLLDNVSDKDVFAELYWQKLARRLLYDKSASEECERSIIMKFRQQCGGQFTSKMERMVNDLALARENQASFDEYLNANPSANPGIDLTVTALTTCFWPSYKSVKLNLPAELAKCVDVYRGFNRTKSKPLPSLKWIHSLGTCTINGNFEPKTIELIVTTNQAAALVLFNESDRLSYQDIKSQLNLLDDDVVPLLYSLSCAKYKILKKEPNNKTVSATDIFEYNSKFTDKMRRIKVPLPPLVEKTKVIEKVCRDRRCGINISIMNTMKNRKKREVMSYGQLAMECGLQVDRMFNPDERDISKGIEDLITTKHLERVDDDDPDLFRYIWRH